MCLDTIVERRTANDDVVKAWKLMCVGATKAGKFYLGQYYDFRPHFGGEDFRVAEEEELLTNYDPFHYISGFHAYRTREDAEKA